MCNFSISQKLIYAAEPEIRLSIQWW